jgi:hypothetical protein
VKRSEVTALAALVAAAVGGAILFVPANRVPRSSGPLACEAYVWQRRWGEETGRAVREHGPALARLVVLVAEVGWQGGRRQVARTALDHAALASTGKPVGLALRIGPYPGPSGPGDAPETTEFLAALAAGLLQEAAGCGLRTAELQVDFDCAASKLDGYRVWVEAIRDRIAPAPLTITVLPSWLDRRGFGRLVAAAAGFVLQVHSLERPAAPGAPLVLCDPASAARWVERAARFGAPFRVALPTYGYRVAFAADGKLLCLSAEGEEPLWPEGAAVREARADPAALAGLVALWTRDRPANLAAAIWYRLPVGSDVLNWRWTTLAAVMAGREPRRALAVEARRPERCLLEVDLVNGGEEDLALERAVSVRWKGASLLAGDVVSGMEWIDAGPGEVLLRPAAGPTRGRIFPGERRPVGWLRFREEADVEVELAASSR